MGRFVVFNPLTDRNYVGIMFEDTNVTTAEIHWLHGPMSKCGIFRVVNGESVRDD
jgi:hypothetical protein